MEHKIKWKTVIGEVKISEIAKYENKIGFKFPKTYKELISKYDAAEIINNINKFEFFSNNYKKIEKWTLGDFFAFNKNDRRSTILNQWERTHYNPEDYPFPKNLVPFADGLGSNLICFDYRHDITTNDPKIVFWDQESERGTDEEISFIANNFDEFLDMLFEDKEN